jgi:hypothetical protein
MTDKPEPAKKEDRVKPMFEFETASEKEEPRNIERDGILAAAEYLLNGPSTEATKTAAIINAAGTIMVAAVSFAAGALLF